LAIGGEHNLIRFALLGAARPRPRLL